MEASIIAKKVLAAGGRFKYVGMDEPLFFGHYYSGSNACKSSIEEVANRVAAILSVYRSAFPGVEIGDNEPFPGIARSSDWQSEYATWAESFQKAVGVPIAFLHADFDWNSPRALDALQPAASMAAKMGMRFGVIYNGNDRDKSDLSWIHSAKNHIADAESRLGGRPDNAIFQSWVRYPTRSIPETGDTLTGLIAWYVSGRSASAQKGG
jgi:hypothetical protein